MNVLKFSLIFCLLASFLLAGCNNDNNSDNLFNDNIIYAPPGLEDDRTSHVHSPGTSEKNTDDTTEAEEDDTTAKDYPSDTDIGTDTKPIPDTEPAPETDAPAKDTTDTEDTPPVPITPSGVIDMSETLAVGFPVSGRFVSEESSRLALAVDYECTMGVDGEVTVTVEVGLLAHSIRCGGRPKEMGNLTVDGVTYNFSTSAISNDSSAQIYIPFASRTYTVDPDESSTTVTASWMFNGTYGGEQIEALTAGARFIW